MALTTSLQGSCSTFPPVHSSLSRGSKLNHSGRKLHEVGRISFKCRSCSCLGSSIALRLKPRSLCISAFKGSTRHGNYGERASGSNPLNAPVNVSYIQKESGESMVESSKGQNVVAHPEPNGTTTRSLAIQNLFRKWLMLLRTQPQTQPVDEALSESSSAQAQEIPNSVTKQGKGEVAKKILFYFLSLDATIKIPLLIFTPAYLAVNIIYGSEVSKELTPLWIIGPLIVALYIKMFRAICGLYVFSFKQTVKVVTNLPAYFSLTCDYLFRGKLNEAMNEHLWKPLADVKNKDYKKVLRRKLMDLQVWLVEKYLDFVESIWPYYCRTIRFLKRANLI